MFKVEETKLKGAFLLRREPFVDERGWFLRLTCEEDLREKGLASDFPQTNASFNRAKFTMRGLHYQIAPHAETKIVTCLHGEVFDVIVDLRSESATYGKWFGVKLVGGSGVSLFIPEGFAHGFQTLTDNSLLHYEMSRAYAPESARGLDWLDPSVGIDWPNPDAAFVSAKDRTWPRLASSET